MRIAIITPHHAEEPYTLSRCLASVEAQTVPVTHFLIGDGARFRHSGRPPVRVIDLPYAHRDYGDTPRLIGTLSAYASGYDAILWLDADCWLDPQHVERMLTIAEDQGVGLVTSARTLHRPDGSQLGVCHECDGRTFVDTNCYLIMRDLLPRIAPAWGFKARHLSNIGDRIVWAEAQLHPHAHNPEPSVHYTTLIAPHYFERGEVPPHNARTILHRDGEWQSLPWKIAEDLRSPR